MTPVAGGITDADQNRLLLCSRPLEGFGSPSVPIHGVVGMLEEIRRCFLLEVVHIVVINVITVIEIIFASVIEQTKKVTQWL